MKQQPPRRAAVLIAVLVAIALVTVMLTVVTAQVVAQRKTLQTRQEQLQADWLARAGVEWAADRLLQKPSAFAADKADFATDWTVHIVVEKGKADSFAVNVEATLRDDRGLAMARPTTAQFRRTEKDGRVMLERVPREADSD